jgi:hypothetical protein
VRASTATADKEQRALARGEALGFTSREPIETMQGKGRVMRRHERTPTRYFVLHRKRASEHTHAEQAPSFRHVNIDAASSCV